MDGAAFDAYVRTQLAPTLTCGDVVILDNLNVHKSPRAAKALAVRGAWFLFLQKYSPDLNQIGRASCRERVCQHVEISVGAEPLKKKQNRKYTAGLKER